VPGSRRRFKQKLRGRSSKFLFKSPREDELAELIRHDFSEGKIVNDEPLGLSL